MLVASTCAGVARGHANVHELPGVSGGGRGECYVRKMRVKASPSDLLGNLAVLALRTVCQCKPVFSGKCGVRTCVSMRDHIFWWGDGR